MKTLSEIIEEVKSGEQPTYDELLYTVCALSALSYFDKRALQNLSIAETEDKRKILLSSAVWQYNEHFERWKNALDKSPKEYIGWNNDPKNPEYIETRKQSEKIFKNILNNIEKK